MKLRIPIYVELVRQDEGPAEHLARPLFSDAPWCRSRFMSRLLQEMTKELGRIVRHLSRQGEGRALADLSFCPKLRTKKLNLRLSLRRRTADCRLTFVCFRAMGKQIAFTPDLRDLWFDIPRGHTLADRANEVLTEYWRTREKSEASSFEAELTQFTSRAAGDVLHIEIELPGSRTVHPAPTRTDFASFLGMQEQAVSGYDELVRVGRCIDWLYPDDLQAATRRDEEVARLVRLLASDDRRPVAIIGAPRVGKTAIVHEAVRARCATRRGKRYEGNLWLLAPARLISGMSYVGQWEQRWLAILKEARKRDHVLFFDDFLALYQAGTHSQSSLSAAHVLKPHLERQEVRLLIETTPQAWRVLQEQDRGLADMFQVIHLREPDEADTFRILIQAARQLENVHRCRFDPQVIATVVDLQRHYHRDAAFPGKAAAFLLALAVKYPDQPVTRDMVLQEFRLKTGMAASILDQTKSLKQREVVDALARDVIGQGDALSAMAQVVCVAKARLNDPARPLATLLFLGPTGVGKTHCAKALANYLFGDVQRMIRFDMNECLDAGAVDRLVGTFHQPEGLLTAAIRRQPFAVILLDEIEKAHPLVFDLLLQVLGEGRLTDALGRTADFTNAVIIMTSNLGVREAGQAFGFRRTDAGKGAIDAARRRREVFTHAAEQFFRPEFFNRIDRVVPFDSLEGREVRVVEALWRQLMSREGFLQRRCVVIGADVPAALAKLADPEMGARSLRRAMDRNLTQPISARLAATDARLPVILSVTESAGKLTADLEPLLTAPEDDPPIDRIDFTAADDVLDGVDDFVRRTMDRLSPHRPPAMVGLSDVTALHRNYYIASHALAQLREMVEKHRIRAAGRRSSRVVATPRSRIFRVSHDGNTTPQIMHSMLSADDLRAYVRELSHSFDLIHDEDEDHLRRIVEHAAALEVMAGAIDDDDDQQAVMMIRSTKTADPHDSGAAARAKESPAADRPPATASFDWLAVMQAALAGMEVQWATASTTGSEKRLLLAGPGVRTLAAATTGIWMNLAESQPIVLERIDVAPDSLAADAVAARVLSAIDWSPIIGTHAAAVSIDFRTGMIVSDRKQRPQDNAQLAARLLVLSRLPLPEEFAPLIQA